ncbi:MAG: hypothetical protein KAS32_08565, partial [Candidatus Peribacteraceae bacterium]|nr:hypothetical protein [Candidatus Peribacteraceae bacterium]
GNLDSASGNQVMEVLQTLHENDNRTIILVTHEHSTAAHASRIIKLLDGRVESDKKNISQVNARKQKSLIK